jgi:hypothetical protein
MTQDEARADASASAALAVVVPALPAGYVAVRREVVERLVGYLDQSHTSSDIAGRIALTHMLVDLSRLREALSAAPVAGETQEQTFRYGFKDGWRYSQTLRLNASAAEDEAWKYYQEARDYREHKAAMLAAAIRASNGGTR